MNKQVIDLRGPEGNAFILMARASQWCHQLGRDFGPIQKEMEKGTYADLLEVLRREFGEFVEFRA